MSDEATAEDVVQQSMLMALEKPPALREGGGIRPWLATVMRNTVRQRSRSERRREIREQVGAQGEALPSALELTGRAEGQRLLLDALLTLDEDARRLVLLRYDEGLSAAEIARRNGDNHSTVRTQLSRALDQLRAELDRRHGGDRSAWYAGLTPLLGEVPVKRAAAAASAPVLGWGLVVVASVLGLAALMLLGPGSEPPVEPVGVERVASKKQRPAPSPRRVTSPSPGSTMRGGSRQAIAATEVAVTPEPSEGEPEHGELRMRFVDGLGQPVAGVLVKAYHSDPATSGADGRLFYSAWLGRSRRSTSLTITKLGFASDVIQMPCSSGRIHEAGDLVLTPGGDIEGRVVDSGGQPVAGLRVRTRGRLAAGAFNGGLVGRRVTGLGATETLTDAEGAFQLRGTLSRRVDVEVSSENGVWAGQAGAVPVTAGAVTTGVVIVAEEAPENTRIEGRVLDHLGKPVANAFIVLEWSRWLSTQRAVATSDETGAFAAVVSRRAKVRVDIGAPGSIMALASFEDVRAGTLDLQARLQKPGERTVRIVDRATGTPIGGARIRIRTRGGGGGGPVTDAGGLGQLSVSTQALDLTVEAAGYGSETHTLEGVTSGEWKTVSAEDAAPVEITLSRIALLSGSAIAGEKPIRGEVTVRRIATRRVLIENLPSLVEDSVEASGDCDADGRFALTLDGNGRFMLRVEAAGYAPLEYGPFDYSGARGLDVGSLALSAGGTLVGRVVDGDTAQQRYEVGLYRGDGVVRSVTTEIDGTYRFEHVTPGPCFVRAFERDKPGRGGSSSSMGAAFDELQGDTVVREDEVTTHDVFLGQAANGVELRGRLRCRGFDPTRFTARLVLADQGTVSAKFSDPVPLDAEGRFVARQAAPGRYALSLRDTSASVGGETLALGTSLELGPGVTQWERSVSFGEVRTGEFASPDSERLLCMLEGELVAWAPLAPLGSERSFVAGSIQRVSWTSLQLCLLTNRFDLAEAFETVELSSGGTCRVGR